MNLQLGLRVIALLAYVASLSATLVLAAQP